MSEALGRAELLAALRALDDELTRLEVHAEVYVVGGAAMALAYDARRATRDVDAVFAPSAEVRLAAARVAGSMGIEPSWLNDAVKGFLPGEDPEPVTVFEGESLGVSAASPRFLLAMKLMASRQDRDLDDIRLLMERCGLTSSAEAMALVEELYPEGLILPRVRFLLEELYPELPGRDGGMELGR